LIWWAEHQFELMRPLPEGGTQADAVRQYKRATGRDHPDGVPPVELPHEISYLWNWFWELNAGRAIGGMGTMLSIPPTEILAWCRLRGLELRDWEFAILQAIDATFLKAVNKRR
jgi:hypothetical protein